MPAARDLTQMLGWQRAIVGVRGQLSRRALLLLGAVIGGVSVWLAYQPVGLSAMMLAGAGETGTALPLPTTQRRTLRTITGMFTADDGTYRGLLRLEVLAEVGQRVPATYLRVPGLGYLVTDSPPRILVLWLIAGVLGVGVAACCIAFSLIATIPDEPLTFRQLLAYQKRHRAGRRRWLLSLRTGGWSWLARRWLDATGYIEVRGFGFSGLSVVGAAMVIAMVHVEIALALIGYDLARSTWSLHRSRAPGASSWWGGVGVDTSADRPATASDVQAAVGVLMLSETAGVVRTQLGAAQPYGDWAWGVTAGWVPVVTHRFQGIDEYRVRPARARVPRWLVWLAVRAALARQGVRLPARASFAEMFISVSASAAAGDTGAGSGASGMGTRPGVA